MSHSNEFTIPKNREFHFTVTVLDQNSFLAQDLTHANSASLTIIRKSDLCTMFTAPLTVTNAIGGVLSGVIAAVDTDKLDVMRGGVEDGYYLKSGYIGTINITFDDGTSPIDTMEYEVYVAPKGVTCV